MSAGADLPDRQLNVRPSRRPRLAQVLQGAILLGCLLTLVGVPVWFFMHASAMGWQDGREVTATVAPEARCRTGPPPGEPRTCAATWAGGGGDVSNRYGGPSPAQGEDVTARQVGDGLALTGYRGSYLWLALASPYVAGLGLALGVGAVGGLLRLDPRWFGRRTDLPGPTGPLDHRGGPATKPVEGSHAGLRSARADPLDPPAPPPRAGRRSRRHPPAGRHRL